MAKLTSRFNATRLADKKAGAVVSKTSDWTETVTKTAVRTCMRDGGRVVSGENEKRQQQQRGATRSQKCGLQSVAEGRGGATLGEEWAETTTESKRVDCTANIDVANSPPRFTYPR